MKTRKFTLKIWNKINSFCAGKKLCKRGDNILLGISGGPDSMLMLDYFAKMRRPKGFNIFACHLNHRTRGKESNADEIFARKMCAEYGVPFISARKDIPALAKKTKESVERAARRERYKFFHRAARKFNCNLVATAHHSDDNIETIFLNMIRGINSRGLSGIPEKRKFSKTGETTVIRPLLSVSRSEIETYLKINRIPYRKDITNDDEKHTRNWIRKTLVPLIEKKQPKFKEHLLEMSSNLRAQLKK